MAFWGVEVKPGEPLTLPISKGRGRLHISQATLGTGSLSGSITVVQCKVGEKSPIRLCSLRCTTREICPLNIEFEEEDDVVFSIIGTRNVHLTGFYLGNALFQDDIIEIKKKTDHVVDDHATNTGKYIVNSVQVASVGTSSKSKQPDNSWRRKQNEYGNSWLWPYDKIFLDWIKSKRRSLLWKLKQRRKINRSED